MFLKTLVLRKSIGGRRDHRDAEGRHQAGPSRKTRAGPPGQRPRPRPPPPSAVPGTPRAAAAAGTGAAEAPPGPARAPGTPAHPGGSPSPSCGHRRAVLGTWLCTAPRTTGAWASRSATLGLGFPTCNVDSTPVPAPPQGLCALSTVPGLEPPPHVRAAACLSSFSVPSCFKTPICLYFVWGMGEYECKKDSPPPPQAAAAAPKGEETEAQGGPAPWFPLLSDPKPFSPHGGGRSFWAPAQIGRASCRERVSSPV